VKLNNRARATQHKRLSKQDVVCQRKRGREEEKQSVKQIRLGQRESCLPKYMTIRVKAAETLSSNIGGKEPLINDLAHGRR
jgi:hypothetical protein